MPRKEKTPKFVLVCAGLFFIGLSLIFDCIRYFQEGWPLRISTSFPFVHPMWLPLSLAFLLVGAYGVHYENRLARIREMIESNPNRRVKKVERKIAQSIRPTLQFLDVALIFLLGAAVVVIVWALSLSTFELVRTSTG